MSTTTRAKKGSPETVEVRRLEAEARQMEIENSKNGAIARRLVAEARRVEAAAEAFPAQLDALAASLSAGIREEVSRALMEVGYRPEALRCLRKVAEQVGENGLVATDALEMVTGTVMRKAGGKARALQVTLLEMTDGEFLLWVIAQLDGLDVTTRLRFRLILLDLLEGLREIGATHWRDPVVEERVVRTFRPTPWTVRR
jgi:hypothetical protein